MTVKTRDDANPTDPWRQVRLGVVALTAVLLSGTIAYIVLGLGVVDAFYQTLITISTVGFTEVGNEIGTAYRLVTSLLILVGVGVMLYTIGAAFETVMEGRLTDHMMRTRMQNVLDHLEGHIIVCGWGQVGKAITRDLKSHDAQVVVIDKREDLPEIVDGPVVVGDATVDAVLRRAGIERAKGLIIALDSDADCMYVTLTGRSMNPRLFIVARANAAEAIPKLRQAGADRAVSPHEIGGTRMASFMMQPNVADFLGEAMTDGQLRMQLEELEVTEGSPLDGVTISESGIVDATGVTILAIRHQNGTFKHHPRTWTELESGDVPIVLGTAEQLHALHLWLRT